MAADVVIDVRVIPRARKSQFDGIRDGRIVVRLAAPPVDNAANEALVAFLAEALGLPRRNLRIAAGERSRNKRVEIEGATREHIERVASQRSA
jgi:uncharacterized protein